MEIIYRNRLYVEIVICEGIVEKSGHEERGRLAGVVPRGVVEC